MGCPFLRYLARPGAKPLEPFGKGSNALKAGTPDAGPCGPAAPDDRRTFGRKADNRFPGTTCARAPPSVPPAAGVERKRAIYADRRETQAHVSPGAVVVERCEARALRTRLSVRVRQVWLLAGLLRGCLRQQGAAVIVEPW